MSATSLHEDTMAQEIIAGHKREVVEEIMVRPASAIDLGFILRVGRDFFQESGNPMNADFSFNSLAETIAPMLSGESARILIATKGLLYAGTGSFTISPLFYDAEHLVAHELWWWVDPIFRHSGVGSALLEGMEREARTMGAKSLLIFSLANRARYRGYKLLQTAHVKRLED